MDNFDESAIYVDESYDQEESYILSSIVNRICLLDMISLW